MGWACRGRAEGALAGGPHGSGVGPGLPEQHLPGPGCGGWRLPGSGAGSPPAIAALGAELGTLPALRCRSCSRAECGGTRARPVPGGERLFGVAVVVVPKCFCVPPKNFLWVLCLRSGLVLFPCLELIKTHARYGSCLFPARRRFGLFNFFFSSSPFLFFESKCAIVGSG